jgi:NADH-quinone oxidoreductase subunit L
MTAICLLLFMGAMGKSAQFLLHTWLPDAMEGPTPVSALIHAATMVTAGVFLVARMSPFFELSTTALVVVTVIGAITAFFAATVGLVQNDIKRVIAYSTCSQLGYMFVALGVGAYSVSPSSTCSPTPSSRRSVPRRRLGHPRHVGRAGHAQHGRADGST